MSQPVVVGARVRLRSGKGWAVGCVVELREARRCTRAVVECPALDAHGRPLDAPPRRYLRNVAFLKALPP